MGGRGHYYPPITVDKVDVIFVRSGDTEGQVHKLLFAIGVKLIFKVPRV